MGKSKVIGFDSKKLEEKLVKNLVNEQTNRLIAYAKEKIGKIAVDIKSHYYSMDNTGNLLDSLCWVVSYDGHEVGSGFYRSQQASHNSYLHELFSNRKRATEERGISGDEIKAMYPVYGHALAKMFISEHGSNSKKGQWVVYFAILAPYWGYWELGHKNIMTSKYEKFAVMAEFRDKVAKDLKPAEVSFFSSRPSYNIPKLKRISDNMSKNSYKEKRHFSRWPSIK